MSDRSLRITIVGINYAPEQSGIAPYTSGLALGLQARGHVVSVVSTFPHYPHWRIASGYRGWSSLEMAHGVSIRRVRHYVPSRPVGLRRFLSEVSFGARASVSRWREPDVVICVSPALMGSAMAIARGAFSRHSAAAGLIIQDLYSAGIEETGEVSGAVVRTLTSIERWAAAKVDGVAVIHDRFRMQLVNSLGIDQAKIAVVRNWTHLSPVVDVDRDSVRSVRGWSGRKVVLHAGAMGEKQGLENVVEAARIAADRTPELLFVLMGDGGRRRALEAQAGSLSTLQFVEPLPGDDYVRAMRAADVLLVNEKPGVVEMAVPSKLTSYFSTGVPILAATERGSTTADEVSDSGAGVRVDPGNPYALVRAVESLCADRIHSSDIGARGPAYCARVLSEKAAIDGYERWIFELVERAEQRRGM